MCSSNSGWEHDTYSEDYLSLGTGEGSRVNCTTEDPTYISTSDDEGPLTYYYAPDARTLQATLRWTFLLHAYGFAGLFFFLAFYAFFSILNLRSQLSTRPYMSTINSFLCLLGVSRAAGLCIDPYGLKRTLPSMLGSLVWDLGFPCLISSFSLIQIAFLQLTQVEEGKEQMRKKTCLSIIITIHFVTVIATAIYSNINPDLVIVRLGFQLGFAVWGLFLCGSFLYAGNRVLGVLGYGVSGEGGPAVGGMPVNEKGVAGLMAGMMGPGQNLTSSLTAALAPTLLQSSSHAPKIKITDENDRTVSVASNSLRVNDTQIQSAPQPPRVSTPTPTSSSTATAKGAGRPPSPVLPRKKSGGSGTSLRNTPGSGLQTNVVGGVRKKSLTWSESDGSTSGGNGGATTKDKDDAKSESTSLLVTANEKRRGSRKSMDLTEERPAGSITETLLISSGGPGPDFTLQSILSHIAYVNQTAHEFRLGRNISRKNQVQKVIKYASITAAFGLLLCIAEMVRTIGPYGFLVSTLAPPAPWPWFALQTLSRLLEFTMSAAIANISKQPVNRPHHYSAYSFRHKHQRDSLYL